MCKTLCPEVWEWGVAFIWFICLTLWHIAVRRVTMSTHKQIAQWQPHPKVEFSLRWRFQADMTLSKFFKTSPQPTRHFDLKVYPIETKSDTEQEKTTHRKCMIFFSNTYLDWLWGRYARKQHLLRSTCCLAFHLASRSPANQSESAKQYVVFHR